MDPSRNETAHPVRRRRKAIGRFALFILFVLPPIVSVTALAVPPLDHLDDDTATLEGGRGRWHAWYATQVERSIWSAAMGNASLRVDVTGNDGWGVSVDNWPGFKASPGDKQISFWARSGSGSNEGVTMLVTWWGANTDLQTDAVTLPTLTNAWQQATADATAPQGTTHAFARLVNASGSSWREGDHFYIDEVFIGDRPGSDTTAPSAPTDLSVTASYSNRVDLSWTASTDDVGVKAYRIYRDGIQVGNSSVTSFSDTLTVRSGALYTYTVRAEDTAGNLSEESSRIEVRTPPS